MAGDEDVDDEDDDAEDEGGAEDEDDEEDPCAQSPLDASCIGSSGAGLLADFNGDGFTDLAIGVPGEDVGSIADQGLSLPGVLSACSVVMASKHLAPEL